MRHNEQSPRSQRADVPSEWVNSTVFPCLLSLSSQLLQTINWPLIASLFPLEKCYRWTYLQSRNTDSDVENRRMDTSGDPGWDELGDWNWHTYTAAAAAAKSLQSCPTLCDPIDGSPLGSPVPGILQARTLEWVAISLSNAWKWKVKVKSLSRVRLFATPWTAAYQAPLSMGFSRQEYWSGVPLPSSRNWVSDILVHNRQYMWQFP